MSDLQARLRADLLTARKARDTTATAVLRSTLAAIANAEALPVAEAALSTDGPIAGASTGVGATEAARRELTDDDVRRIITEEQAERIGAATDLEAHGADGKASELRAEAELLAAYV
ncbi:hypothetical protein FB381_3193 [Nocardioides albertanoniae]|uniref:GatB/YqeY domain-containing protein n=1 Tax=Nocardioides albertanoniae TaxID=1175486 RepID=A0A543A9K1_9ACTN|nr:hypothetical protein [Nocardioides albertanoniae]TQL69288.1 hypothetical protein FB381_3193 [Nocardioides albertanoniae]